MAKKYKSAAEFVRAAQSVKFKGVVIVDNDCVTAYVGDDTVFDFDESGPECALIDVLEAIGAKAERP